MLQDRATLNLDPDPVSEFPYRTSQQLILLIENIFQAATATPLDCSDTPRIKEIKTKHRGFPNMGFFIG
jgi:hypothetical protein